MLDHPDLKSFSIADGYKSPFSIPEFFSALLLASSWVPLSRWYLYLHNSDFWLFWLIFSIALIIGGWSALSKIFTKSRFGICVAAAFVIFCFPWGEFLHQNFDTSREDWSRQLFFQAVFVYASLALFRIWPALVSSLEIITTKFLNWISSLKFFLWLFACLFFLLTAGIALFVSYQLPNVQDSASYLFQAKVFLAGKIAAPIPAAPEFFNVVGDMLVMKNGHWFSMYLPGYSMLLAAAMVARAEWFLSPVLGAFTIAIWIAYARRWHGVRIASGLAVVLLFSPFLFLMFSSIMVHTVELFLDSAALYLSRVQLEAMSRNGRTRHHILGLSCIVFFGMIARGYSMIPFLVVPIGFTCWQNFRAKRYGITLALIVAVFAGLMAISFYQAKTTGDPFTSGYHFEYSRPHSYGFGPTWTGSNHTPLTGLENTSNQFLGLNSWLTGWYSGALIFVLMFFVLESKITQWDYLLMLSFAALVVFYYFYPSQDLIYGPRYYLPVAPVFLLFFVRVALNPKHKLILALCVLSFLTFLPVRFPSFLFRYGAPMQAASLSHEIKKLNQKTPLVFLEQPVRSYLVNFNDPFLRGPVLAVDIGQDERLRSLMPDHPAYYFGLDPRAVFGKSSSAYTLFSTPNPRANGQFSFFELAMAIQTAGHSSDQDFFDLAYHDLFSAPNSSAWWKFLDTQSEKLMIEKAQKQKFHSGLIHVARSLLLPKIAFEQNSDQWKSDFDCKRFVSEMQQALRDFQQAGEIGRVCIEPLQKVEKRIDGNQDGISTCDEVNTFLDRKVQILRQE